MGIIYNSLTPTEGLVLSLDSANRRSYPGSGNTWFDLSGNGNNGSLTGGPVLGSGLTGGISFDGVDDHVAISRIPAIENISGLTIAFWTKFELNALNLAGFFSYGRLNNFHDDIFIFYQSAVSSYRCQINNGFDGSFDFSQPVPAGWAHHVFLFSSGNLRFFLNGLEIAKTGQVVGYTPPNTTAIGTTSHFVRIGGYESSPGGWELKGRLDDIRLYNRALSVAEVRQLFNARRRRYGL